MSFDLEFNDEFFFAEGEPYDRSDYAVNKDGNPTSLYSAICMMNDEEFNKMAVEVFGLPPGSRQDYGHEFPLHVLWHAKEINTCTSLTPPVEVWIDPGGNFKVKVYD